MDEKLSCYLAIVISVNPAISMAADQQAPWHAKQAAICSHVVLQSKFNDKLHAETDSIPLRELYTPSSLVRLLHTTLLSSAFHMTHTAGFKSPAYLHEQASYQYLRPHVIAQPRCATSYQI